MLAIGDKYLLLLVLKEFSTGTARVFFAPLLATIMQKVKKSQLSK